MSIYPNASRSSHVRFQLDSSGHTYPTRSVPHSNHSRNESGSSFESVSPTASFFPLPSNSYHHRHTNSGSSFASISSFESVCPTPDKRRTIPLPPLSTPTPSHSDQWARHTLPPMPQIANDLNLAFIHAGLTDATLDSMLASGKPATVPEASSMRIEIAGLPYYAPLKVLPSHGRSFVTGKDVVRAVVGSLRTPLRPEEILAVQRKPRISDHTTNDIRRCALLPNGENTCLKGFMLIDAQMNLWRLG